MQTTFAQLVRQQIILKGLGFYKGAIDGVWGPETIDAKKRFERDMSYLPGLPNNGLPFPGHKPFPSGMTVSTDTGLLHHPCIDTILREEEEALKIGPPTRNAVVEAPKKKVTSGSSKTPDASADSAPST